jgi:hypothetical protein
VSAPSHQTLRFMGNNSQILASANGLTSVHGTKTGSAGSVTTDLIRDAKAHNAELERLCRHGAWMKAVLSQAIHAGFVYVDFNLGE